MDPISRLLQMGAAGAASAEKVYVEDVFSTWLYTGNGSAQAITNGINLGDTVVTYLTGKTLTDLSTGTVYGPVSNLGDGILEVVNGTNYFYTTGVLDAYVDLGSSAVVTQYLLAPQGDRDAATYNNPTGFNVKASNDASSWTTVATFSGITTGIPNWNPGTLRPFIFSNSTAYRYWRLEATNTGASLSEWVLGVNTPGSGKGGLVWIKKRVNTSATDGSHALFDSLRGSTGSGSSLATNTAASQTTGRGGWYGFTSSGFNVAFSVGDFNYNGDTYASWTFRKAEKFFDVCTWTGSGANRTISHNLGSVPGCIIVKRTDTTGDWQVYHRSLANTEYMVLNSTAAKATGATRWNSTTPTSTVFSLGTDATVNASGGTYVAYLFAHDAGGFGDSGNDSVVSCGSYTGSGTVNVSLGWEPQWILLKDPNNVDNWYLFDTMRGITLATSGDGSFPLNPNTSGSESGLPAGAITVNATGFSVSTAYFLSGSIYIAIRRGPMKTPTDATKVFGLSARTGTGANATVTGGQLADSVLIKNRGAAVGNLFAARLTGVSYLEASFSGAEIAAGTTILQANPWDVMDGVKVGTTSTITNASSNTFINYLFRRAPGFFDAVCYAGTGVARTVNHNLGVVPELYFIKNRTTTIDWIVGSTALTSSTASYLFLNTTDAEGNASNLWQAPTSTTFGIGTTLPTSSLFNASGNNYIAYLFATCPGVSKVGSYTGTGTTLNIDCGFTAGARFVLIKRTDSTGDWYVWDTARGIVSGNDPYLLLNSTAAEVTSTDYIDPLSSGFQISSTAPAAINANGGSFIFLAIA